MNETRDSNLDQKGGVATTATVYAVAKELKRLGLIDKSICFGWNADDMNVFFEVNGRKHRVPITKISST